MTESVGPWPTRLTEQVTPTGDPVPEAVVRRLVKSACHAPSIYNTQPWLWRVREDGVELYADQQRRLSSADPEGRSLTLSCGAALHHLQVAARASGWEPTVARRPDPAQPDLLATITLTPSPPPAEARVDLAALYERCTDRRRFTSWPVPNERLQELSRAVESWGGHAVAVTDAAERFRIELLISRALQLQSRDPAVGREQRLWTDNDRPDGVRSDSLPATSATAESRRSRFGTGLLEERGRDLEGSDGLLVLCDADDDPAAWLRGGEALSALWLRAVRDGMSVVPLSQVVEVDETRAGLRHDVFGGLAHPLMLVRVGWQAIGRASLTRTSRRPLAEVLMSSPGPSQPWGRTGEIEQEKRGEGS